MQHPPMQIASPSRVRSARPGSPPRDFSRVDSNEQRKEKVRAGIREYGEENPSYKKRVHRSPSTKRILELLLP